MDVLEHPLEDVAFRLYSLPAEASAATGAAAWTCLAAVLAAAAAAGLWRLRSSTPAASTAALKPLELEPSLKKEVPPEATSSSARSSDSAASTTTALSPKERYTAYYRDSCRVGCCVVDDDEGDNEKEEADEQDEDDGGGVYQYQSVETTTHPLGWEVVRSLPLSPTTAAEVGRYRSPTALSSSVVRLWDEVADGGVAAVASPRRRSRLVGAVSAF